MRTSEPAFDELELQVVSAIAAKIGRPASEIRRDDDLLADLGLDSLAIAELTVLMDQVAGHTLPSEQLIEACTVGDLLQIVHRCMQAPAFPNAEPV